MTIPGRHRLTQVSPCSPLPIPVSGPSGVVHRAALGPVKHAFPEPAERSQGILAGLSHHAFHSQAAEADANRGPLGGIPTLNGERGNSSKSPVHPPSWAGPESSSGFPGGSLQGTWWAGLFRPLRVPLLSSAAAVALRQLPALIEPKTSALPGRSASTARNRPACKAAWASSVGLAGSSGGARV